MQSKKLKCQSLHSQLFPSGRGGDFFSFSHPSSLQPPLPLCSFFLAAPCPPPFFLFISLRSRLLHFYGLLNMHAAFCIFVQRRQSTSQLSSFMWLSEHEICRHGDVDDEKKGEESSLFFVSPLLSIIFFWLFPPPRIWYLHNQRNDTSVGEYV